MHQLTMAARPDSVGRVVAFVAERAQAWSLDSRRAQRLELAVEEAVANVCRYAYPGSDGEITVRARQDSGRVVVEVEDQGVPFDPTSAPPPDLEASLEERPIGGLGIAMLLELMDDVSYRREGDSNLLTLTVMRM